MAKRQLIIPDFDTYPITHALRSASVIDGGVTVHWDDGIENRLPGLWLREFSPDASTVHSVTREQIVTLTDIPADVTAAEVSVTEDGYLRVHWMPEGLESHYHPGWLRTHRPDMDDPIFKLPERQLWRNASHIVPTWKMPGFRNFSAAPRASHRMCAIT